jgi:uncharacterized membrane protein YheB (UPF0754 family)
MSDQVILQVREMSRESLENLVLQSMTQWRLRRQELQATESFIGILLGFVVGALVSVGAFFR